MQRIDENTYIDDTLVTCAEYQLFIDEMREQGKYYQPDHWTSYQFPKGQAREPILGVRHSDAVTFCEWLIKRDGGEWKYRLPSKIEVKDFSAPALKFNQFAYWMNGINQCAWADPVPTNARGVDIDLITRNLKIRKFDRRANEFAKTIDLNLELDLDHTLNGHLELVRELEFACTLDLKQYFDPDFEFAINHALNRASELTRTLDRSLNTDLYRALKFDCTLELVLDLKFANSTDLYITLDLMNALNHTYEIALVNYYDLFTLHERIAGRSPAFEGIRLVKERIR